MPRQEPALAGTRIGFRPDAAQERASAAEWISTGAIGERAGSGNYSLFLVFVVCVNRTKDHSILLGLLAAENITDGSAHNLARVLEHQYRAPFTVAVVLLAAIEFRQYVLLAVRHPFTSYHARFASSTANFEIINL